jgi:hypothetical protein
MHGTAGYIFAVDTISRRSLHATPTSRQGRVVSRSRHPVTAAVPFSPAYHRRHKPFQHEIFVPPDAPCLELSVDPCIVPNRVVTTSPSSSKDDTRACFPVSVSFLRFVDTNPASSLRRHGAPEPLKPVSYETWHIHLSQPAKNII